MKTLKKKKKNPRRKGKSIEKREPEFSFGGSRNSREKERKGRLRDVIFRTEKNGLWIFGRRIAGKEERNKKQV